MLSSDEDWSTDSSDHEVGPLEDETRGNENNGIISRDQEDVRERYNKDQFLDWVMLVSTLRLKDPWSLEKV